MNLKEEVLNMKKEVEDVKEKSLANDIGEEQEIDTIEIEDVKQIDNSHIKIGDDVWKKIKNGRSIEKALKIEL